MKIKPKIEFFKKLTHLFTKREKWQFMGILCVALLMAIFQALGVASIIPFISLVMEPEIVFEHNLLSRIYNLLGFETVRSFIIFAGIIMLAIIIAGNVITALAIYLKTKFAWRKNHSLSSTLLKKYLSMPYSYFLNQNTADLNKNVLAEIRGLIINFILPILEIITDSVVTLIIFITLIVISPKATATVFIIFLVFYGVIYKSKFRSKLKKKGNERLKENKGRFKAASEALGGIKDIKILGRENYFIDKFANHSLRFSDLLAWNSVVGQIPRYFIEIIAFGGVIFFILLLIITEQDIGQIIPMVSFFVFAGYRVMPVLNRMFVAATKLQFNRAVLDKIHSDLKEDKKEIEWAIEKEEEIEKLEFNKKIEFKNMSFSYPGTKEKVLKDINLTINKSTSVAIAGPTGTGKTTFVDLILGLLNPTRGKMEVDGVQITQQNVRNWQKNLGYVPQFIYLSDDTIANNIAFGLPQEVIDLKRVQKVAKISNLHDFIESLPNKYNTVVGERGVRLSGGQRQRVGIARALYNDPDVLVLDEATSSLDGITEESVLSAMENISKLKTLISIAHRLTTVKNCDTIYLMDKGKIVDSGKYDELMKRNVQFRAMAREK